MSDTASWREKTLDHVIHQPILKDSRSTAGTFLGWPKQDIFHDVIQGGQANFDSAIGKLTGDDKALLYAKYNQPGHLTELDSAFTQLLKNQGQIIQPYIFDIGCGPFTAGLSLAQTIGPGRIIHYYGIDLYKSMRELAGKLVNTAKSFNGINNASTFSFFESLSDVPTPQGARNNAKIFIASYLLSSNTLDVNDLANSISNASRNFGAGPSFLLYTNSSNPYAARNYPAFKTALEREDFECAVEDHSCIHHMNRERKLHYALFYKKDNFRV